MNFLTIILSVLCLNSVNLKQNVADGAGSFNETEIIFYNLKTKETFGPPITTVISETGNNNLTTINLTHIRLPFIGQPCGCCNDNSNYKISNGYNFIN